MDRNIYHTETIELLIFVKQEIDTILSGFIFDPDDVVTREAIAKRLGSSLEFMYKTGKLCEYTVVVKESDRGTIKIDALFKYRPQAEQIHIPIILRAEDY